MPYLGSERAFTNPENKMINQLAELVKVYHLTPKGLRSLFLNPKSKGEKVSHLLKLIMDNPEISDGAAKEAIYGDKANSNTVNYNMLKAHLREKLLKYIYFIPPKRIPISEYRMAYFTTYKQLFLSKAMFSLGLTKSGIVMAKNTLKKAMEIELWDIVASLASSMSNLPPNVDSIEKLNHYDDLMRISIRRFDIDRKARMLVNRWNLYNIKNGKPDIDDLLKLKQDVERIKEWNLEEPTTTNTHLMYRLTITYELMCNNYTQAIKTCDEAIIYLQREKYFDNYVKGIYVALKMFCYLNLRDILNAKNFAQQGLASFPSGTINWFTIMEFYYVLSIQVSDYHGAYGLLKQSLDHPALENLSRARRGRWMILQAYMNLLVNGDIWENKPKTIKKDRFKVDRFINQVDIFKKDKTGLEVSILVVFILFKIMYGQFEDVIDKRDSLSRFIRRYLNQEEHARSRVFLTMLKKTIDLDFSYQRVKNGTEKLYASLKSQQMNYSYDYGGNEIVDYEVLWEWLLTRLKNDDKPKV